jgi:hypothetical protein
MISGRKSFREDEGRQVRQAFFLVLAVFRSASSSLPSPRVAATRFLQYA